MSALHREEARLLRLLFFLSGFFVTGAIFPRVLKKSKIQARFLLESTASPAKILKIHSQE